MNNNDWLTRTEKRNYQRIDAELDVKVTIDGKVVDTTSANISCGGVFLPLKTEHNAQVKSDSALEVFVHLPDSERPVKVVGVLCRKQEAQDNEGIAIRFSGLYDDNILAIDRFIKNRFH